jgi:hypothetical protein
MILHVSLMGLILLAAPVMAAESSIPKPDPARDKAAFEQAAAGAWEVAFSDPCTSKFPEGWVCEHPSPVWHGDVRLPFDNQNRMPNIQSNWQTPNYKNPGGNQIFGYIFRYLGLQTQPQLTALPNNLVCPGVAEVVPEMVSQRCWQWHRKCLLGESGSVDDRRPGLRQPVRQSGQPGLQSRHGYSKVSEGTTNNRVSKISHLTDGHGTFQPHETRDPVHGEYRNCFFSTST